MLRYTRYNAFGEPDENIGIGVKSKKYDEGLIVYSLDDITVEIYLTHLIQKTNYNLCYLLVQVFLFILMMITFCHTRGV